jgi:UDP-N-acetylmuramate dehydrogenase
VHILENVSLANYSTMRLGGRARYLADAATQEDIVELVQWAQDKTVDCLIIGGGSNIVWRDEGYDGLIIVNKIKGRQILEDNDTSATIRLGAGEHWDEAVDWTVGQGLSGIEFLSLIPGSAGAAPVQNIGAYGAELSETLVEVAVYDTKHKTFGSIAAKDCGFAYRTSRFKTTDKGRFVITSLVLKLKKSNPKPPFYEVLQAYLDKNRAQSYTPEIIRNAVIAIRSAKLPDPAVVANNGSFFTNPFVSSEKFDELKAKHPEIKGWPHESGIKLSAGWLVEQAGFLGYRDSETGMATSEKSALVLINEHAKSTGDLLKFKQKIVDKVSEMFDVTLDQETELLP